MAKRSAVSTRTTTFDIEPVPASRPRVTRWGAYYGKKYTKFKKDMEELVGGMEKTEGLLKVDLVFWVPMAKSWSKKKKAEYDGQWCDSNSDIDNLQKAVLDSMNGYAYDDDRQIVDIHAVKKWAVDGKIEVRIDQVA